MSCRVEVVGEARRRRECEPGYHDQRAGVTAIRRLAADAVLPDFWGLSGRAACSAELVEAAVVGLGGESAVCLAKASKLLSGAIGLWGEHCGIGDSSGRNVLVVGVRPCWRGLACRCYGASSHIYQDHGEELCVHSRLLPGPA